MNDELIKANALHALELDPEIDISQISIEVKNGVIFVRGTVDSGSKHDKIIEDIDRLTVHDGLVDEIRVEEPKTFMEISQSERLQREAGWERNV